MSILMRRFLRYRSLNSSTDIFSRVTENAAKIRLYSSKTTGKAKNIIKLGLAGVTVGAIVGTGYSIHSHNKPRSHIMNEQTVIPIVEEIPKIKPSREIRYANDGTNLRLILFQYQTCPFCCKVRAFLDFHGISYDVIEVDPVLRQSIKWSPYKKVPILVVESNGKFQPMNDSSMIISALATYIKEGKNGIEDIVKCYPFIEYIDENGTRKNDITNKYFIMFSEEIKQDRSTTEISEERKWRKWVDDVLVHTLSPNIYRTREEAIESFNWFSEAGQWEKNFPEWERQLIIYVGAHAMWMIGKKLKKKYLLKDDVRQSLYDECNFWMKNIRMKGGNFMGGEKPNLADLAVFGVLNSIEGCSAFEDLLKHSSIGIWFKKMKNEVRRHKMVNV